MHRKGMTESFVSNPHTRCNAQSVKRKTATGRRVWRNCQAVSKGSSKSDCVRVKVYDPNGTEIIINLCVDHLLELLNTGKVKTKDGWSYRV